jgi:hypothetical protein
VQFGPIAPTGRATEHEDLALDAADTLQLRCMLDKCRRELSGRVHVYSVDGTYDKPCTRCVKRGTVRPAFMGCQAARTCFCIDWEADVLPCLL